MSTTPAWKYHNPFPFCPAHKTTAQINADYSAYTPGTDLASGLLKFSDLDDAMNAWWMLESIDLTLNFNGSTDDQSADIVDLDTETKQAPKDRVCADSAAWLGGDNFGFAWDAIYYNTTESEWWMLFRIEAEHPDGYFIFTATIENGTSNGHNVTMFGQTQRIYSDDALASMTAWTENYYTIA